MQLLEELALDALNKQTKKHLKKQKIKLKLKYIFLPPPPNGYNCTKLQGNETFKNLGSNYELKFRVALYLFRLAQNKTQICT